SRRGSRSPGLPRPRSAKPRRSRWSALRPRVEMPPEELFAPTFLPTREVMEEGMAARQRIIDEIRALGLIERAWELDVDGYTVLRPHEAGDRGFAARLLDACLALAERKSGRRPDLATEDEQADLLSAFGNVAAEIGILGEDAIFEQALLNRPALALI